MTTILYDCRIFRNSAKRYLHTSDPRGSYVGTVGATEGGLRDFPDMPALSSCLPGNLRKAFKRAGTFWFNKDDDSRPGSLTLYTTRGKLIGTIYAERKAV